jgi:O-antigen/teichoic acid export membrane protein
LRTIVKAYSSSLLGIFSGLLTQLVFIRELVHVVSQSDFAIYAFTFQIVTYLSILQLGLDFATSREIAIQLGKGDYDIALQSYHFIKKFNNKVVVIGLMIVSIIAFLFYNGIGISSETETLKASLLVLLFGLSLFISFFSNPYMVALIGSNKQHIVNYNNIVVTIISTIIGFFLLKKTSIGIYSMPISLIFFNSINIFILRHRVINKCSYWMESSKNKIANIFNKKDLLKFSIMSSIGGIAWTIEATSDVILLNSFGLITLVSYYVLWWRFPQMSFDLATRLTTSTLPSLNSAFGSSKEEARILFNRLLMVVSGMAFCIFICIVFWLPSFVNLWVGSKYDLSNKFSISLVIGLLVYSRIIGNCLAMFLITIGKINFSATLSWLQAIVKVVFAIFLIKKYGLIGVFISSIISSLIQIIPLTYYFIKKEYLSYKLTVLLYLGLLLPFLSLLIVKYNNTSILGFTFGVIISLLISSLIWVFSIKVSSLDKLVGFPLNRSVILDNLKKIKFNV